MLKKYKGLTNSEKKLEKKSKKISVGIFYPYVFRHIKNVNHLQKNQKKERSKKMINNKTDIIGYMQLFFKFWPIGSPEEAYYMEYKCDFAKPLNEDFFKYVLGTFGKVCEEQDEKKRIFEGKYIDYETYVSECLADDKDFSTQRTRFGTGLLPGKEPLKISQN